MRRPQLRPLVLLLCVPTCLPGCHTWQRRGLPTGAAPAAASGEHRWRVTRTDGSEVVLNHARVVGDSVVGERRPRRTAIALGGEARARPRRTAVPLGEVRLVEERRVSGARTALLVGGVAVGALALLIALAVAAGPGLPAY